MEFTTDKVAKTVAMVLSDPAVAEVYGAFGDGCLRYYGIDISNADDQFIRRSYLSTPVMRMVQSFVKNYGKDNALGIVNALFGVGHEGMWRGEQVGKSIFMTKRRWLADELLLEHQRSARVAKEWEVPNVAADEANGGSHIGIKPFVEPYHPSRGR